MDKSPKTEAAGMKSWVEPSRSAGSHDLIDMLLDTIADALIDRLQYRESTRNRLLTSEKAAEYLGISEDQIYNLMSVGKLSPVRFDRWNRFDVRDLDRLIEESKRQRGGK